MAWTREQAQAANAAVAAEVHRINADYRAAKAAGTLPIQRKPLDWDYSAERKAFEPDAWDEHKRSENL